VVAVIPLRVLDLFCCKGGASQGIKNACDDVDILGVDILEKTDYPFDYVRMDVTEIEPEMLKYYDFIWASPPCQSYTYASKGARNKGKKYPDLVDKTRKLLLNSGKPFVIENVTNAPIRKDLILCGEMFGLKVIRHRAFEIHGFEVEKIPHKKHTGKVKDGHYVTVAGHGGDGKASLKAFQDAMEITWTKDKKAICEAVPPRYAEYIFLSFLKWKKDNEVTGRASSQD
jgi:DNA (cytosine-5)-methyltransferase 1